jgi:integrase
MAKPTPLKGRPAQSKSAPGVFLRGETFWLRYSAGGEQVRISLDTTDPAEANKRADEMRGRPVVSKKTGKTIGGKTQLERDSERYQAAKLAAGDFTPGTAKAAGQAIANFQTVMGITDPARITAAGLAIYFEKLKGVWIDPEAPVKKGEKPVAVTTWKKSVATAQTYVTKVGTFARWLGYRVSTPKLGDPINRDLVIPQEKVWELIELATTKEMKFVLMGGFFAGMRRGEIAWARPAWFDFERGKINVPSPDLVTGWVPKSRRKRSTPITPVFADFIAGNFPDWKKGAFCLRPEVAAGKAIYRFDTRKMFEAFAKKHCPELTPHVMRHTYITRLANNPKISIAQLSEFSGDRIATLERHYIHLDSNAKNAAESFEIEPPPADPFAY